MEAVGPPGAEAWHEAGHALVARLLGGRVRWVTLESEEDGLDGHAAIEWGGASPRELATRSARTALAGPLAELAYRGSTEPPEFTDFAAWERDWNEVERTASELEPDPAERGGLVRRWIEEVRGMLAEPEVAERLARVADALDAHRTLDEGLFEDAIA